MIQAHSIGLKSEWVALPGGLFEIFFAIIVVVFHQRQWPVLLAMVLLLGLLVDVAILSPGLLIETFNPVTTNIAVVGLCLVNYLSLRYLKRQPVL